MMENKSSIKGGKQTKIKVRMEYLPDDEKVTYECEMMNYMKCVEIKRYNQRLQSPQIAWRRSLVDWICVEANKFSIENCSTHLAIKLLDSFMGSHDIEERRLYFVSIGCLRIATKFEERDSKVPKLKTITAKVPQNHQKGFKMSEYRALEEMILKHFNWNVFIPTASHFVDLMMPFCISKIERIVRFLEEKRKHGISISKNIQNEQQRFRDHVNYFLDISLQEVGLLRKLPSRIASAVIYCSRQVCQLDPFWPSELQSMSGVHFSQFEDCATILTNLYETAIGTRPDTKISAVISKRSLRDCVKEENSSKRQKLWVEADTHGCPYILTPASDECIRDNISKVPSNNHQSELLCASKENKKNIPVIDISPDDGYASMSSNSGDTFREYNARNAYNYVSSMDANEISNKEESDVIDKNGPKDRCSNSNAHCYVSLADYPSTPQTKYYTKNCRLKNTRTKDPSHISSQSSYMNCKRNLRYENFSGETTQNQVMTLQTDVDRIKQSNRRSNFTYNGTSLDEDNLSEEVIIIKEKIFNQKHSNNNKSRTPE